MLKYLISGLLLNTSIVVAYTTQDLPTLPTEPQRYESRYGSAQRPGFTDAINGTTGDLTEQEQRDIEAMLPEDLTSRFFIRIGVNFASNELKLKNKSTGSLSSAQLVERKKTTHTNNLELAWGYKWENFLAELEYFKTSNTNFNKNTLFKNRNESLTSDIKSQTLLINGYYDFPQTLMFLNPYLGLGLGPTINRTESILSGGVGNGATAKKRSIAPACSIAIGTKIDFTRIILNIGFRYLLLSKVTIKDDLNNLTLKGSRRIAGFSIGAMYLI